MFGSDGSVSASTYNTLYEDSKPPSSFASTCCSPSWAAPKTSFSTGTEKVPGTTDARDSETFMPLSRPSYVLPGELFRVTFSFFSSPPFPFFPSLFSSPRILIFRNSSMDHRFLISRFVVGLAWKIWITIFKNFERNACCNFTLVKYFDVYIYRCIYIYRSFFLILFHCSRNILNRFWTYWLNFQAKVQESQDCYLPKYNTNSISFTLHLVSGLYILNDIKTRKEYS